MSWKSLCTEWLPLLKEKDKEIERLRKALQFYAEGKHLDMQNNTYETGAVALRALKEGE